MPDEKIEVNYVRLRLGNSYKCKELLASFLTALSLIYAFYLIAVSAPGPIPVIMTRRIRCSLLRQLLSDRHHLLNDDNWVGS